MGVPGDPTAALGLATTTELVGLVGLYLGLVGE
jgi:hypothetical protein